MRRLLLFLLLALSVAPALGSTCSTAIAGVKKDGLIYEGILANLTVEVVSGKGRVFVDTMPLTQVDTQASARLAKEAVCELLSIDCRDKDFFYIIRSEHPLVGGPSAGAAMASCTLSLLTGASLYNDTIITGTINPDGSVGPVGGVFEKLVALKDKGYKFFLAPDGLGIESVMIDNALVEINITEYALTSLGIQFIFIDDIIEAFKYMSGYTVELLNVSSADVASQEYAKVMESMSSSLINESVNRYEQVKNLDYHESLSQAASLINESRNYHDQGIYYSAASYAVRSLIFSTYINYLKDYSEGDASYVSAVISNLNNSFNEFSNSFLSNLVIDHVYDLESLAVTIDRLREAESLISQAQEVYELGFHPNALYLASFADVRLLTTNQWSDLINYFRNNDSIQFNINVIVPLVIERLEQARNSVTYANTMLSDILNAGEHLSNAIDAFNEGKVIYSLFEALKARAEANLAMEIRGLENISMKIDSKINGAVRAINRAEERGLLPFLSISFLEYSSTFTDEPLQELIFLSYSKEFASISSSLNDYVQYSELPAGEGFVVSPFKRPEARENPLYQIILVIIGFVFGLIVTLIRFES